MPDERGVFVLFSFALTNDKFLLCQILFHKVKLKRACLKNLLFVITNFHLIDSDMLSLANDPGFTLYIFGMESREKIIHVSLSDCGIMSIGAGGNS